MAWKAIKTKVPRAWDGTFELTGASYKLAGQYSADANSNLQRVTGNVMDKKTQVATFEATRNGDHFNYNINNVQDITILPAISVDVNTTVETIVEDLEEDK